MELPQSQLYQTSPWNNYCHICGLNAINEQPVSQSAESARSSLNQCVSSVELIIVSAISDDRLKTKRGGYWVLGTRNCVQLHRQHDQTQLISYHCDRRFTWKQKEGFINSHNSSVKINWWPNTHPPTQTETASATSMKLKHCNITIRDRQQYIFYIFQSFTVYPGVQCIVLDREVGLSSLDSRGDLHIFMNTHEVSSI